MSGSINGGMTIDENSIFTGTKVGLQVVMEI